MAQPRELLVQVLRREQTATHEEFPERLLARLLKREDEADLQRREQPQAMRGLPDALQRQSAVEEGPHLRLRKIPPAQDDFTEPLTLATLEHERLDQGRKRDDAGVIEELSETQAPAGDGGARAVFSRAMRRGARGAGTLLPGTVRAGAGRMCDRRGATQIAAAEIILKQAVGATSLDEALIVSEFGREVGRPVRVGQEGLTAPGGAEPRFLDVLEERGVEPGAEQQATGLKEFFSARRAHPPDYRPVPALRQSGSGCVKSVVSLCEWRRKRCR